ncbi:MAG: hemolysin family protein [Thermoanaerobaculia bacterium]|nr:hemolysin family protein [Thermoanaerobaculia bacterium]
MPFLSGLVFLTAAVAVSVPTGAGGEATSLDVFLLLLYTGVALVISFLCSILEAALLSIREVSLENRAEKGHKGAKRLLHLKRSRLDDSISAILILNTVAHTAGVAGAGLQAGKVFAGQPFLLGLFPVVLTLLILVLTEIVPKTLGAVYASRLVGFVGLSLSAMVWLLTPFLYLTRVVTGAFTHSEGSGVSRGELAAMVAMAAREGTLRHDDSRLVSNVLRFHEIRIEDVMTPRTVVAMVDHGTTRRELAEDATCRHFSRVPLYEGEPDRVLGYVLQREVLSALARGEDPDVPVSVHLRKSLVIPAGVSVDRAMRQLIEGREHLAMVADEFGGLAGILTLEDLMETLLGVEIIDESDRVADLRQEAMRLRDKRLRDLGVELEPDDGESG